MSITPLTITGVSTFSENLQTIMQRAVSVASLPVQILQNEQSDLLVQKQLLTDLRSAVASLADAIADLGALGGSKALGVTTSNANRVTASVTGSLAPAVYTITEIASVAKAASENTTSGFATADSSAVDADGTLELVLGSNTYTINLGAGENNNLEGLRDAINALGIGVNATVVNTGTGATPYYLNVASTATGETTLKLRGDVGNDTTNLLTAANQGADAVFKLNGLDVRRASNSVDDVVAGITFQINGKTDHGEAVTVSLASNRGSLALALRKLVDAYNTLRQKVNAQVGEQAGLLSGEFVVRYLQERMRALAGFRGTGSIDDLSDLGITFDTKGLMSLDSTKLNSLSASQLEQAFRFLDSSTLGFGTFAAGFRGISDPVTGMIRSQQDQIDETDARLARQVEVMRERIEMMQRTLALKLQQADALLASLESQQRFLEMNLEVVNLTLFGKKNER